MSKRLVQIVSLGRIGYPSALELQNACARALVDRAKQDNGNTLFLLEHSPVYTIGIRSNVYTADIEKQLRSLGADFHRTNRGGLITFHGPGQLVAYPVISLKYFQLGMKAYVKNLEQTIIETCRYYGLKPKTTEHTGVWIGDNKIAAIGVHGSRFVVTHGLALNCDVDLTWFDHIIPCGIDGKGVTSLTKELERRVTVNDVSSHFLKSFSEVFDCSLQHNPIRSNCTL